MYKPPRAYSYNQSERTSSCFSQTIMLGPAQVWICLTTTRDFYLSDDYDTFYTHWWFIILITIVTMLFISAIKVHAGSIFPTDALFTMPVCILNIALCQVVLMY